MIPARIIIKTIKCALYSGEILVLGIALMIATAAISTITLFNSRIDAALLDNRADLLGAQLVIIGNQALPNAVIKKANDHHLTLTKKTNFLSMVTANKKLKLANIMAATQHYPLFGTIKTKSGIESPPLASEGPKPGFAYVDSRLLAQLNLTIGQSITIGYTDFIAQKLLVSLPSPAITMINIAPRVLINAHDLKKTGVIKPGSRVQYEWFFTGTTDNINLFSSWLNSSLDRQYNIISSTQQTGSIQEFSKTSTRFMNLAALASILFAGIALVMSTSWFFTRQQTFIALLRTFGTPFSSIRNLYLFVLIIIALFSIGSGMVIGVLIQGTFVNWLVLSFDSPLPPPAYRSLWLSIATGFLLLIGFALPRIMIINTIKPISLFRGKTLALKGNNLLLYSSACLSTIFLLMIYTNDIELTLTVSLLILLSGGLFWILATLLKYVSGRLSGYCKGGIQLALIAFRQQSGAMRGQLLAFSLVIMVAVFIGTLQHGIIKSWLKQLPANTPNYFLMNIAPNQVQPFKAMLSSLKLSNSTLYPVVRARLIALNNKPILSTVPPAAKNSNALYRALNLSSATALPYENKIIKGRWLNNKAPGHNPEVSVDAELAVTLNWKIGDILTLKSGTQWLKATITSTRAINWNTFTPNFYLLFNPKTLRNYPQTYMTSLYIASSETEKLLKIITQFPNISVFDISAILNQVQDMLTKLSQVIILMLFFVLLSGVAILISASQHAFYENKQRIALLRAFGAQKRTILVSTFGHYLILGLACGIIGTTCANIGASVLAQMVFKVNYYPSLIASLLWPLAGMSIVTLFGIIANFKLFKASPTILLSRLF